MSFIDDLRYMVKDMLQNVSLLKVKTIRSIGRKPMRFEHDSGGSITFNSDGTIDIIGLTSSVIPDPLEVSTIQSKDTEDLTFESATGVFIFKVK